MRWKFKRDDEVLSVELTHIDQNTFQFRVGEEEIVLTNPKRFPFSLTTDEVQISLEAWTPTRWRAVHNDRTFSLEPLQSENQLAANAGEIRTQMPGRVLKIFVEKGQTIKARETLLILEAMKMENEIRSETNAVVASIEVTPGQSLESGAVLIRLEKV